MTNTDNNAAAGDAAENGSVTKPTKPALEELVILGSGTSGSVPNIHCLTRSPILCKVCFEACCYEIVDEETGETLATGSQIPAMGGREISALLAGPAYFRAILSGASAEYDSGAAGTNPINGLLRPANDVFPSVLPLSAALDEKGDEEPLKDYPGTSEQATVSKPHRRHLLKWNPNRRRNTSAALRFTSPDDGTKKTVVIDCGKSFYEASLEQFPKHGMRKIDALVLTHGHADACFGLDDLRQWTIGPPNYRTQDAIDVFLDQQTYDVVGAAFPYLVDKKMATGGGDVTSLKFNLIKGETCEPFVAAGLEITPFPVEHGILHSTPEGAYTPYISLGFRVGPLAYISDISKMTAQAWDQCRGAKVMVLDSLNDNPHPSHFSIPQAIETTLEIKPKLCLLVGWSHFKTHEEINRSLAEHEGLKAAGIVMRAAYDGEKVKMSDWE